MARPVAIHRQQQTAVDEVVPGRRRDGRAVGPQRRHHGRPRLPEPGRELGGKRTAGHRAMLLRWATLPSAAPGRTTPTRSARRSTPPPARAGRTSCRRSGCTRSRWRTTRSSSGSTGPRRTRRSSPRSAARSSASPSRARPRITTRGPRSARCTCSTCGRTPRGAASGRAARGGAGRAARRRPPRGHALDGLRRTTARGRCTRPPAAPRRRRAAVRLPRRRARQPALPPAARAGVMA